MGGNYQIWKASWKLGLKLPDLGSFVEAWGRKLPDLGSFKLGLSDIYERFKLGLLHFPRPVGWGVLGYGDPDPNPNPKQNIATLGLML